MINNFSYTYDLNSNQLTKTENSAATSYTYDELDRLKTVDYAGRGLETYTYDNAGNRLSKVLGTDNTTYAYDSRNRLTQSANNGTTTSYSYDNKGNLLKSKKGSSITTYSYDGYNRLQEATMPDGNWTSNEYDAFGLRVAEIENGTRNDFTLDGQNVIAEKSGESAEVRYIRGISLVAMKGNTGDLSYYLHNAHGDVVNLIGSTGNVLNSYSYDAFGNALTSTETVTNRFMYAGEQFDKVTGEYYLRARFYDPATSRMLTEDTYRGDVEDPLSLNLYTYCKNNPILYVDRTGHSPMIYDCDDHYIFVADDPYKNSLRASYGYIPFVGGWIHDTIWEFGGFTFIDKDDMVTRAKSNMSLTMDTLSLTEKVGNIESIGANLAKYLKTIGKAADIVGKALTTLDVINEAFVKKEWEKNELVEKIFGREVVSTTKCGMTDKYIVALSIVNQMVDDGLITYESNGSYLTGYSYTDNEIMESARKVIIDIDKADNYDPSDY